MVAPAKLDAIVQALGPRLASGFSAGNFPTASQDIEPGCPMVKTSDGIAIISVDGNLVYKSSWLSAVSGLVSYADVRASLDEALADPSVSGILLQIDSCGGEVNGCFDLSDAIYAARRAKPIYGVAADDSYSAAYALLSACSRVFVSRTSGVGSIGVVAMHVDQSAADSSQGLKYTYVFSGTRKVDGNPHQTLSTGAQGTIQAECDRLCTLFASSVGKYRGLSTGTVLGMEAACFFGEKAVKAGLADQVGTPDDALAALRGRVAGVGGSQPTLAGGGGAARRASAAAGWQEAFQRSVAERGPNFGRVVGSDPAEEQEGLERAAAARERR